MARRDGKCLICGCGPTVKAHLFPRALMLDIRAESQQLVAGHRHRDGVKLQQNGEWDDGFLCLAHEKAVGAGDDYAVRFCRKLVARGTPWPDGRAITVPNPSPDQLVHFAYASVWRHVCCASGRALGLSLGDYEPLVRQALLAQGPYDLELLVGITPITIKGEGPIRLAVHPYRVRLGSLNVWHFTIGGLEFYLKTDQRPFPSTWQPYLANDNDPIVIGRTEERGIHEMPRLLPILRRMQKSTWKG